MIKTIALSSAESFVFNPLIQKICTNCELLSLEHLISRVEESFVLEDQNAARSGIHINPTLLVP